MKSLILPLMIFPLLGLGLESNIDLKELYKNAEAELRTDLLTKVSNRFHRKKVTDYSRAMEDRNAIFQVLVRTLMEKHGMNNGKEAKLIAKRSMAENRKSKQVFAPGGQSGKTAMVKMIDDLCTGNIPTCDSTSPFRTINGQCNNLNQPFLGAMSTPFLREIQVDDYNPKEDLNVYTDLSSCNNQRHGKGSGKGKGNGGGNGNGDGNGNGKGQGKGKGNGNGGQTPCSSCSKGNNKYGCPIRENLPSARTVSHNFHTDTNVTSNQLTHMVAQFGQFLDHDVTLTPESEEHDCCSKSFDVDDDCFPIEVSENDSWYGPRDVTCLEFSRSVAFCQEAGGPRTQVNVITAFVDASNVYSSDDETAHALRTFQEGKMKTGQYNLLPMIEDIETEGDVQEVAGDVRAFDMPGLATMHTLFLREHNRICDLILEKHYDWSDEKIYQNARRILVAEMQSIVFGQYLPVVLGSSNLGNDLQLSAEGTEYDPNEDPTMTTEFSTAAYRFGHTLLQGLIKMFALDNSGQVDEYPLAFNFFRTEKYYENNGQGMEQILMGLLNQPAQSFDKEITSAVTNQLFPEPGKDFGEDLISRNLQRGRDHGIHGFCCYYKLFQDPTFNCKKGWEEKYEGISDENWSQLQMIYNCPSDIDLFTGGLAQAPFNDGITGQVFNQIKINQFKRSMAGDRFFFTHKGQAGSFTSGARQTLISRTLGSIICENTGITSVPPNVFFQSDVSDFVDCSQMATLGDIDNLLEIETD